MHDTAAGSDEREESSPGHAGKHAGRLEAGGLKRQLDKGTD
jgi:hypothetical protein